MRKILTTIILGLVALIVDAVPAFAQYAVAENTVFARAREWQTGEVMQEDNGQFAYCASEAVYENGLALIFARTADGMTNIIIGFPEAVLVLGASYPVTVQIDDRITRQYLANVSHEELLVIPMGDDEEIYEALQRGNAVHIIAPEDRVSFALTGTSAALSTLKECSAAHSGGHANDIRRDLPPALGALLYAAGLEEAQLIEFADENGEVPEEAPDYTWVFGPTLGGVIQRSWNANSGIEDFNEKVDDYITQLEPQCEGDFYAEKKELLEINNSYHQSVDIYCTQGLEGHFTALLLFAEVATDEDINEDEEAERIGRFTVFFQEGEGEGEQIAQQVRDNLALVLRHLNGDDIEE